MRFCSTVFYLPQPDFFNRDRFELFLLSVKLHRKHRKGGPREGGKGGKRGWGRSVQLAPVHLIRGQVRLGQRDGKDGRERGSVQFVSNVGT
jgi:hypothetical protein